MHYAPMPQSHAFLIITLLSSALLLAGSGAYADSAEAGDLNKAELLRNPVIGNYRGYAEFKMGHYRKARTIWQWLADTGNAEAHFNLGILYEDGLGVSEDIALALEHYQHAASAGSSKAQYRLGVLYSAGVKTPRDEVAAARWLTLAAAQGDQDAVALLALNRHSTGSVRDRDYYQAERHYAAAEYRQAAQIWRRLAEQGDSRSRTRYAWLLEAGKGVKRNLQEAGRQFRRSAEQGDAEAQYALAVMLQTGQGQPRDPEAARQWMCRAAQQGFGPAREACPD